MKKLTALLLSVVLVLSLAACGSANKPASSTTQPETSAATHHRTVRKLLDRSRRIRAGNSVRDRQDAGGLLLRFR